MVTTDSNKRRLRIRHSAGSTTIGVKGGSTVKEVGTLIEQSINVPAKEQCWKVGFPPKNHSSLKASDCFPDDINLIHVSKAATAGEATIGFLPMASKKDSAVSSESNGENLLVPVEDSTIDVPPLTDLEGFVVRRVIDADNSCLFNSIGYSLLRSVESAPQLRKMIAKAVLNDPSTFHEAFLGRPTDEYADWICQSNSWGGQIELSIFSKLFRTEIAAYDVIRNRHDVYGSENNYKRRILVIYDGIHYDALAFCFDPSLPAEMDVTQFSVKDEAVLEKASALCSQQHQAKNFTDTSNFTLRCLVCQQGLKGQKEAAEHAKTTGHANFSEYR